MKKKKVKKAVKKKGKKKVANVAKIPVQPGDTILVEDTVTVTEEAAGSAIAQHEENEG
jgi:hypothetical protein